jgi:hypothetical protein
MPELVKSGRRLKLVDVCSPLDLHKSNQPRSKGTSRDALLTFTCIYRFVGKRTTRSSQRVVLLANWGGSDFRESFIKSCGGRGERPKFRRNLRSLSAVARRRAAARCLIRRYALPRAISFFSTANICIGGAFRCCTRGTGIESQAATRRTEQLFEARSDEP